MQERILTAQHVSVDLELAGVGRRILAAMIDYVLLASYIILIFVGAAYASAGTAAILIALLPVLLYSLGCEVLFEGQSVGKYWCGIRVVDLEGGVPTGLQYVLRWMLRPVDIHLAAGSVGVVSMVASRRSQRLGDLVAGTLVVRERADAQLLSMQELAASERQPIRYPQVEHLSDEDIATARAVRERLLSEGVDAETIALCRRLQEVLTRKMGVASDEAPRSFVRTVIADYDSTHVAPT